MFKTFEKIVLGILGAASAVVLALTFAAATLDVRDYIEVQRVEFGDAKVGEPVFGYVARDLRKDFSGFYTATVRQADGGATVCTTGVNDVPYRRVDANDNPTRLPSPMPLSFWAWGGSCDDVLANGLPAGTYSVETCHGVYRPLWFVPQIKKCWEPWAVFSVEQLAPEAKE